MSAVSSMPARARTDLGELRRALGTSPLLGLVAAVGVAGLVLFVVQAPTLVHSLNTGSDDVGPYVLPSLVSHAPAGSVVTLGDYPWYEPYWWARLTIGFPDHRLLWEAAPIVLAFLGFAVVSACARWALGWPAALLTAAALVSESSFVRGVVNVSATRVASIVHVGVLCGALLFVLQRARSRSLPWPLLLVLGVTLALFTGAGATDLLVVCGGVVPYMLAPLWLLRWDSSYAARVVAVFALVTGALSLIVGVLLTHLMVAEHVIHAANPISFVAADGSILNLQNFVESFVTFGGGDFFGLPVSGASLYVFALGGLVLLALALVARAIWRWAVAGHDTSAQAAPRNLFIAFFSLVLVFVIAVFALTDASRSVAYGRYLLDAWVALAALLGAFAGTPRTLGAIAVAVSAFAILTLRANVADGVSSYGLGPDQTVAGEIEHFALSHGARIGYGAYEVSAVETWATGLRLQVYPIQTCAVAGGEGECPTTWEQINSWYTPRPRTRSILLTDSNPAVGFPIVTPPPAFGQPIAQTRFGTFYVFVFNHDIAADFG